MFRNYLKILHEFTPQSSAVNKRCGHLMAHKRIPKNHALLYRIPIFFQCKILRLVYVLDIASPLQFFPFVLLTRLLGTNKFFCLMQAITLYNISCLFCSWCSYKATVTVFIMHSAIHVHPVSLLRKRLTHNATPVRDTAVNRHNCIMSRDFPFDVCQEDHIFIRLA